MLNYTKIEHVLSAKFVMACVSQCRTKAPELVAVELQYAFNREYNFDPELLSKPEYDVSIQTEDVLRALNLYFNRTTPSDPLSTTYQWARLEVPLMTPTTEDKAWAKFVAYVKEKQLFSQFGGLSGSEVKAMFAAVYKVVKRGDTLFCL